MIGSLRGTVLERTPTGEVLVEVGGVGYRVLVPLGALAQLEPGAPAFLFTHLHVREDAMVLYGFPTRDERDTFEALIGATGVGPKLALAMLSVHSPGALRRALARRRPRRAHARAGRGQAHRAAAAGRAQVAPRGARPRPHRRRRPRHRARRGARGARGSRLLARRGARRARPARRRRLRRGPAARRVCGVAGVSAGESRRERA